MRHFSFFEWMRCRTSAFHFCLLLVAASLISVPHSGAANGIAWDALDCMPSDASGGGVPSLPFYQPKVGAAAIDLVVRRQPNTPLSNRFTIWNDWDSGSRPLIPIASWALQTFTGFAVDAPLEASQRGHIDAYANSGVQASGAQIGLWLNSMDADAKLYHGSNSLNLGCWYNAAPYPRIFHSFNHELDVSFDAGVTYDGSTGNAHAQSYFQLIAVDTSGGCGQHCHFTVTVGFYARDSAAAAIESVHGDATGTTELPIAQAGLESPNWLRKQPDSMPFKTATFPLSRAHFRISPSQFIGIRNTVASLPSHASLSSNPLDYGIALLNVNGEVYDPCKDDISPPLKPCLGGDHAQMGMSVRNFRVESTIPHEAAGAPWGFSGDPYKTVFKGPSGTIQMFSKELGVDVKTVLANGTAAGDPVGIISSGATLIFYRDNNRHIRAVFRQNGSWVEWDMSSALGAADAYTDPRVYQDANGRPHLIYRDVSGEVHEYFLDASGWHHQNISLLAQPVPPAPALGTPMTYAAGSAQRVVFRSATNQVIELYCWAGEWHQWDMTTLPGAATAYSDPKGFVDQVGVPRVVYRDIVGDIHEMKIASGSWQHSNVSEASAAPLALGSPMGFVAGGAARIVYRSTDDRLQELVWWSGSWIHNNLSNIRGVLPVIDDPMGYVDADGVARIVYKGADAKLHELYYDDAWLHRDL